VAPTHDAILADAGPVVWVVDAYFTKTAMSDSTHNLSDLTKSLSGETLTRLLSSLSPDIEEAAHRYNSLHADLVKFFNMKGVSDPKSAADEVLDRAARRISEGAPVTNVNTYCIGIARNVAKEIWRKERRENSALLLFPGDVNERLAEEVERIYRLLKPCFEQLTVQDQELLRGYCQTLEGRARAEHRRRLADEMKTTQKALRIRITRLRHRLWECVRKRSKSV
jgi:DNA-directed RNA polymerase specialized sigma24 family protein